MNVHIRTIAREDILRQYRWYLDESGPELAERFLNAIEAAIETLRRRPDIGAPQPFQNPLLAGLPSWPVPGFTIIRVYYLRAAGSILVVRVLHGKRDIHSILEGDQEGE